MFYSEALWGNIILNKIMSCLNYEKSLNGITHALSFTEKNGYVPCDPFDHVLVFKEKNVKIKFLSFLDGSEVTEENYLLFCEEIKKLIACKEYPTTDHLFISVEVDNVVCLYVSLDNSVRANNYGYALYKRLPKLCEVVSTCISNFNNKGKECLVFFSESCRPSFDGCDLNNRINEMSWFKMRQEISRCCKLEYLGECTNNEDPNCMAFGVSAFCTAGCISEINGILPRRILTEGYGSGALGVKFQSGKIIWGIHFPVDFKNSGTENFGYKAMVRLSKIMETHQGSILAMGDFNTIPGKIIQSIAPAILENMELLHWNFPTYFGSYYDTIMPREGETWILI
jgi:hypothetical protein